jgi:hypothetical protein
MEIIMNAGDRVKLVKAVGVYPSGCKGIVDSVGHNRVNVTVDEDENGFTIEPKVPLPLSSKNSFVVI